MKNDTKSKHYFLLIALVVLVTCACFAFYNIYTIENEKRISSSPLEKATTAVLYDDLKNTITDLESDTFLVISYVEDEKIYNKEKEMVSYLKKKNFLDNTIYLNVTEYKNNEGFIEELNTVLGLEEKINTLPALIYYKNGIATCVIDSSEKILSKSDLEKIFDMYEIAS